MVPQTKEEIKEYHRKYRERPEVQEYVWQFNHSEKGKQSRQKYYYSEKGKKWREKHYRKPEVRERKNRQAREGRKRHPPKCDCDSCTHKRDHNRVKMKEYYKKHSLKTCQCEMCQRRRERNRVNYMENKRKTLEGKRRFKQKFLELLGGKCACCGFIPIHPCQIDIHERNGKIAKERIGKSRILPQPSILMGSRKGRKLLIANIDQVVPLCRNCHIGLTCTKCRPRIEGKIKNWRRPDGTK